ncbi:19004_t:CDS:2, partial [Funneliformis geosporum]
FCDKKFCKKSSTNEEGKVLICDHAYHEEYFWVLEPDINEKIDEDNCELEETDSYKLEIELKRILDILKILYYNQKLLLTI